MKLDRKKQVCDRCKNLFAAPHIQPYCSRLCANKNPWNKGKKCPQLSGKNNGNWKSDNEYFQVHSWMVREYGKANKCESNECNQKSEFFEWALLKGKDYKKDRSNFWQLCKSCHRKYDFTEREYKFAQTRERDTEGRFICLYA